MTTNTTGITRPFLTALVVHLALAAILATIPLYRVLTQSNPQPASVRFTLAGMAAPGGTGLGEDLTATILQPGSAPAKTFPPMPPVVIGVIDPAAAPDVHLNISIGSAPLPGSGDGNQLGSSRPGGTGQGGGPAYLRSPKPAYPDLARQRGWEGTTVLRVEVRADGTVGLVEVRQSSGHRLLDDTSIETVRSWKFNPARRDDVAVATWVEIPIRYQLNQG